MRDISQVITKSSDKLIPKQEAMEILGVRSDETMSRLSKKHNLSAVKEWKRVFYYEDEILNLKFERENKPTDRKPNANLKRKKEKKREELIAKKTELVAVAPTKTPDVKNLIKAEMQAVAKELKDIGIYEICDKSLIYSYCVNEVRLNAVIEQMGENFTTYDHNGNEKPSALVKVYNDLLGIKLDLARALGIGAGSRKGLKLQEVIEVSAMEKLLND